MPDHHARLHDDTLATKVTPDVDPSTDTADADPSHAEPQFRVGIVCPYDLSVPGGVQSHVCDVVTALLARDADVHVLAPVSDPAAVGRRFSGWPAWLTNAGTARGVNINGSTAPVRIALGQRALVANWLQRTGVQIVHVHEPFVPALARPAVHSAWRADIPVVGTFHAHVESAALLRLASPWLRQTLTKIKTVIAVSDAAAATARTLKPTIPITVIPNPVAVAAFKRAVIPKPGPGRESGQILFLGRGDEPRKGLDDLLTAWPLIRASRPHAQLLVAGRMTRTDLPSGVQQLGEVTDADKPGVFANADVYVAPNRGGESMGIVLVEAMASGTAVVATDLPAFVAVSQNTAARHVPVRDPISLAAAVVAVLDDESLRTELVAAGLRRADDFDVVAVTDALLDVFVECLL